MKRLMMILAALAALVLVAGSASAVSTTIVAYPYQVPDEAEAIGDQTDNAPGWDDSCWQANGLAKTNYYTSPEQLFGRSDVTIGELASISYYTKKDSTHAVAAPDWYFMIYTKPYTGSPGSSWYGNRINSEPYFSDNMSDPVNTWNQWNTGVGETNRLRFFDSSSGYLGSYTDPFLLDLTSNAVYMDQEIMYFTMATGSAWAAGFEGRVDGLSIELTGGAVGNVNFEAVPEPAGVGLIGLALLAVRRRRS